MGAGDDSAAGSKAGDELTASDGELSTEMDELGCTIGADGVDVDVAALGEKDVTGGAGRVEEEVGRVSDGIVVQAGRRIPSRKKTRRMLRTRPLINWRFLP